MKVLKFGAVWCSSCLVMRPRWEKIEQANSWLQTEYYDVDEFPEMIKKYSLKTYPSFIWLDKDGNEIIRREGEIDKKEIIELINEYKEK